MATNHSTNRDTALWVTRKLRKAGFQALLAGGCVRDMLLGAEPADYDVATDATPEQVQGLFRKVLMVGAQFGVAMVVSRGQTVEVTTFRADVSYTDGRRPYRVVYADARADAMRRDFTINGMFLDPLTDEVIDFVAGRRDLAERLIRAIGDAEARFAEDYLRMLRAVRFAARLDFALDPATAEAIARHAPKIERISGERVRDELEKMLAGPHPVRAMALMHELGLAGPVLGEWTAQEEAWRAAMGRLAGLAERHDAVLALAALLGDRPVKGVRALTRRWGTSNEVRESLAWLIEQLPAWPEGPAMELAAFKKRLAHADWPRLLALWRAEELRLHGQAPLTERSAQRAAEIAPEAIAPPPWVSGEDLKALGLTEGPRLGRILRTLYDRQLNEEFPGREQALGAARAMVERDGPSPA